MKLLSFIALLTLTGCMWETQNRAFPKPVFIFSREAKEYRQEQRNSERAYEALTNEVEHSK